MEEKMRLNKYISASGFCSRRKADEWIASGRVFVNGKAADMGMKVSDRDEIIVDGKRITHEEPFKLVAFYKPKGYACTHHRGDASGVFQNFPLDPDLRYVGRLDKDSEGLLLLTNDGSLGNSIARARNGHEKEYLVRVDRTVTEDFIRGMEQGVRIFDPGREEWVMTRPCRVKKKSADTFTIILTQGMNRQIRRMCEQLNYRVLELRRVRVMNIELGDMKPGMMRDVTGEELVVLRKMVERRNRGESEGRSGDEGERTDRRAGKTVK